MLPVNVMLPSLEFILKHNMAEDDRGRERWVSMHTLMLDRENAIDFYERLGQKRADAFNEKIREKGLHKGMLVTRYNNALDSTFQTKFKMRWEGLFVIKELFDNGSYQLMDVDGKMHKARINGIPLKPYVTRIM